MQRPPEELFGYRMRVARERAGLSQRALAERIKETWSISLDPTAITRLERGTRALRANEAVAISDVLGEDIRHLLGVASDAERVSNLWRRRDDVLGTARDGVVSLLEWLAELDQELMVSPGAAGSIQWNGETPGEDDDFLVWFLERVPNFDLKAYFDGPPEVMQTAQAIAERVVRDAARPGHEGCEPGGDPDAP